MSPAPCAGCLNDRKCWVCGGTGLLDNRETGVEPCHRCFGSGICYVCQPIQISELGRAPALRVPRRWQRRSKPRVVVSEGCGHS
jgi:hypothetical protein